MKTIVEQNEILTHAVLAEAIKCGVTEFCLCPGARNVPFLHLLKQNPWIKVYYWYEERSAAFFALGRVKATGKPAAVITTSGTAAGELLPAAMEAYYVGAPLMLITADRPRRFRGSGAPQSAEQKNLFGVYAHHHLDLEGLDPCDLSSWEQRGPCHLNVCLEEPAKQPPQDVYELYPSSQNTKKMNREEGWQLDQFLEESERPFVVVSALERGCEPSVEQFLLKLNAPVYLEGVSNLRESSKLNHLRIHRSENLWKNAETMGYKIDGILRIGGIPTFRMWRDLENKEGQIKVCSISENPFPGLSWGSVLQTDLDTFFKDYKLKGNRYNAEKWLSGDKMYQMKLLDLMKAFPKSEPAVFYRLSEIMPRESFVFLGNSLPIREWDLAAGQEDRGYQVAASRGVNGIDGQLSTFLGMCAKSKANVGIFGDLTALYDLAAPWIIPQLDAENIQVVVINNSGGQIFNRMFADRAMLNEHELNFEHIARHWNVGYRCWREVPDDADFTGRGIIEIVPDDVSTEAFWQGFEKL